MKECLQKAIRNGNLQFKSSDFNQVFTSCDAVFVCVNTPPLIDQSESLGQKTDLRAFQSVISAICKAYKETNSQIHKIIINKSTVPIGTSKMTENILIESGIEPSQYTVVSMPEFLAEGQAIQNLMAPDRVVIGAP